MTRLNTLDLFSGIGGISYALKDIVNPLLYCDIDPNAQRVLKARMNDKQLHTAPIVNDVRHVDAIQTHVAGRQIDLVISSSSCVGFSVVGAKQGLENPETGMMVETMNLIERFRPAMVFMENVPGILKVKGGEDLRHITRVFKDMGYTMYYDVFSAQEVGAWHLRKRWFGLAVRHDAPRPDILATCATTLKPSLQPWKSSLKVPLSIQSEQCLGRTRLRLLGNSVVPACVRHAFFTLAQRAFTFSPVLSTGVVVRKQLDLRIEIDPHKPGFAPPSREVQATSGLVTAKKVLKQYPTPRAQNISSTCRLTNRCCRDLGSVVKFQTDVPWPTGSIVNPQFVEFLMGFPIDFTAV